MSANETTTRANAPEATRERGNRRHLKGVVTSDRMTQTITVRVERTYKHPKYGKFIRKHKKYTAHDEEQVAHVGDIVEIVQSRPISKTKRWRLVHVLESAAMRDPFTEAETGAESMSRRAEDEASEE